MSRYRYGVVKRSSPERRTFRGYVFDSLLEHSRAQQLAVGEADGYEWAYHPMYFLGCPENKYKADFKVKHPRLRYIEVHCPTRKNPTRRIRIDGCNEWVEEIKGPVRTGIGRLKELWKKYGPVPLIIHTGVGRATGLKQQWRRELVIPKNWKPSIDDLEKAV